MAVKHRQCRIATIQLNAGQDFPKNLKSIRRWVQRALKKKPHLIALPEVFYWRGPTSRLDEIAHTVTPQVIDEFKTLAKRNRVAFLLGSVLEPASQKGKYYNTCIFISEAGRIKARYRKIHLYDSQIRGARSQESEHIVHGSKLVTVNWRGIRLGFSVCYDLRFPELYRKLTKRGAHILFVPANFTEKTGRAHWQVLLRARAIENQAFVVAPGQVGRHPATKIRSFGTSLIIAPWGNVLATGSQRQEEVVVANLDFRAQTQLRRSFPVLTHCRIRG